MRIYILMLFLGIASVASAQDADQYWKNWNAKYLQKDAGKLLRYERTYADSVEKHPEIAQYYVRNEPLKFKAVYLGQVRATTSDVIRSMKQVLKLSQSTDMPLEHLCKMSVLMKVGNEKLWMPIQNNILEALKQEVKKNDEVLLYCVFLNEHTSKNVLYNHFLISEFIKD